MCCNIRGSIRTTLLVLVVTLYLERPYDGGSRFSFFFWLPVDGFSTTVLHSPRIIREASIKRHLAQRSRSSQPNEPYDNYYNDENEDEVGDVSVMRKKNKDSMLWDEEEDEEGITQASKPRGGLYKVQFDAAAEIDPKEIQLDWEQCSDGEADALVLLPPEAVERPSAVLHFVGGTFFGSLPKIYYRSLLEGLVRNTQCAIVVTPIPVTLLKSPLQHISLGRKLQASFESAWTNILEDEYGDLSDVVSAWGIDGCKTHDNCFSHVHSPYVVSGIAWEPD